MGKLLGAGTIALLCISLTSCSGANSEQTAEAKRVCSALAITAKIDISGLSREAAEKRFTGAAMSIQALAKKDVPPSLTDSLGKLAFSYKDFVARYKDSDQSLSDTLAEINYQSAATLEECAKYLN